MELSQRDQDALTALAFNISSSPGEYAFLLGAGVSMSSGIPSAWKLLMDLVMQRASVVSEDVSDPEGWFVDRYGKDPSYQGFLEEMAATRFERQALLKQYFDPTLNGGAEPTVAHRAIARLVKAGKIRLILTTNFDHLMEEALSAEGISPTVVSTHQQLGESLRAPHTYECLIVHLHGDYLSPAAMLNTVNELEDYHPYLYSFLSRVFSDYGLVIAGWSAEYDDALEGAISSDLGGQYALTWIEPRQELNPTAAQLLQLRGNHGRHVKATADDALGFLESAVQAIEATRARHPHSVAVAAAIAKRELDGRPVSIRLHDLLQSELRLLEALPELTVPHEGANGDHPGRAGGAVAAARRLAEAGKVPAAILAVLAYWGRTEETDAWVVDAILRFSLPDDAHWDPSLANAPLVIGQVLYRAAACAAVAAGRWELAWKLIYLRHPDSKESWPECSLGKKYRDVGPLQAGELRAYPFLAPVLEEALLISAEAIGKAWERFELAGYFDRGYGRLTDPSRLEALTGLSNEYHRAQFDLSNAKATGLGITEAQQEHGLAFNALRVAQRELLDLNLWNSHIRVDHDPTVGLFCPAAQQMLNESGEWSRGHRQAGLDRFIAGDPGNPRWDQALPFVKDAIEVHVTETFTKKYPFPRSWPMPSGTVWLDEV
ncbi:SIR2 family protein [Arthrobacter woluwensis]|uniref:SIR2 family protein n=1 Tax=Arthrobacter woluwensis TaxID=156980 RepID=UPI0037F8DD51